MRTTRDNGLVTILDPGSDRPLLEVKMLKCVHCGGQYPCQPGSGKVRGFCMRCNGPVCGPGCAECVPEEMMLEIIEGTRRPDQVTVGGMLWM